MNGPSPHSQGPGIRNRRSKWGPIGYSSKLRNGERKDEVAASVSEQGFPCLVHPPIPTIFVVTWE